MVTTDEDEETLAFKRAELRIQGLVLTVSKVGQQYLCTTTQGEFLVALPPMKGETIQALKSRGVACFKVETPKENQCLG